MKKTFVILIAVALLGILAATVAPGQKSTTTTAASTGSTTTATTASTVAATTPTATTSSPTATAVTSGQYKDGTYTGSTASNQYDDIQVAVTVSGGKVTAIRTPTLNGNSGRSNSINSYAVPQLTKQAIAAQSSTIDGVSGASYTADAYTTSLQSALDQAKA